MEGNQNKNQKTELPEKEEPLNIVPQPKIELPEEIEKRITSEDEPKPKPEINQPQKPITVNPDRPQPPEMPIQEKKDLLSRTEVKTMAKDVSELREAEAEKAKKDLINLKTEQDVPNPIATQPPSSIPETKKEAQEETGKLMPKPLKKPSFFQKISIRIIAVLLLIATIAFFYWFLNVRIDKDSEIIPIKPDITEPDIIDQDTINPDTTEPDTTEPDIIEPDIIEPDVIKPDTTSKPEILKNILAWGFYTPQYSRAIDTIIIHSVYNALGGDLYSVEKVIEEFKLYKVTSHYLIDKDGIIYQLAPDSAVAYHAGRGEMPDGSRKNTINNFSLGIEMIYPDTETPNEIQLEKLVSLVSYLKKEYNIPIKNILGHEDVSLSGKDDPWNFSKDDLINLLNNN